MKYQNNKDLAEAQYYLKMLDDSGISRIKSNEFSEITQIPSATIRRDFSQLGELGRSGYGYDVPFLIDVFNNILNTKEEKRIALVGYGNLGTVEIATVTFFALAISAKRSIG